MNAPKNSFVRTALSSPNRYLLSSISENSSSGSTASQRALIAIQSGLKFDCRHPAKVVMLGRVLRPASAVRPTGELAAFLVFRIGRHRQRLCFASRHADARRTSGPCYGSNPRLDSTPLFLGLSLSVLSPAVACCAPARCPLTITSYQGLGTPSVL